jgi:hypothetical protein
MNDGYSTSNWGLSHLASAPVTVSVGVTLFAVLVILIILRVVFADVRVGVGRG